MKFIKSKGFTLVETLLVIAVISISTIKIYSNYRQQISEDTAKRQALYIKKLIGEASSMAIQVTTSATNLATNITTITNTTTTANLLSAGVVPAEMINGGTINNIWSGGFTVSGADVGGTPGLQFALTNIPREACVRLPATNDIIQNSQSIVVNGNTVKNVGSSNINSALLAASCITVGNNITITTDLVHPIKYPGLNDGASTFPSGPNYLRGKDSRYQVAPTGIYSTNLAPSCPAGSNWDSVLSVCSCPSGTQWVGSGAGAACRAEGVNANGLAGLCPLGWGWSPTTNNCQPLPNRGTQWVYNPWVGPIFGWRTADGVARGATRYGNRMIPNHIGLTPYVVPWSISSGNSSQCGAVPNGRWDGVVCQVCKWGVWQGDRCVAPYDAGTCSTVLSQNGLGGAWRDGANTGSLGNGFCEIN